MELSGQVVMVTGANRGIGKAIVEALLKRDVAKVYAAARDPATLTFEDSRVVALRLDITQPDQVRDAAHEAQDVSVLINNAGVATAGGFGSLTPDDMRLDMETNYYGTFSLIRALLPALKARPKAAIVNVTSIAAFANLPLIAAYSASKAALLSLSQGLRIELAPQGIAVHTVNPGPIATDMAKGFADATPAPVAADSILAEFEKGTLDIFPDPAGQHMFDVWKQDYRGLEKIFYDMTYAA